MKKINWGLGAIALCVILLVGTFTASAQALDSVWFQLNISAKGYSVEGDEVIKGGFKTTAYLFLEWLEPDSEYRYILVCNTPKGWSETSTDRFPLTISSEDYIFIPDKEFIVSDPAGFNINISWTALIRAKLDASGEVSSATFSTLGAHVYDGVNPEDDTVYGGASIKGKTIDESKIPFAT